MRKIPNTIHQTFKVADRQYERVVAMELEWNVHVWALFVGRCIVVGR